MGIHQSTPGGIPMVTEDDITKNLSLLEYYKEQLSNLDMQQQYLQAAMMDYQKAKITLEHLETAKGKQDILMPVGSGVFITGQAQDSSKVLLDIGAGIVAEKPVKEAVIKINERMDQVQSSQKKLYETMQQLQAEAESLSEKTQQMMAEAQQK